MDGYRINFASFVDDLIAEVISSSIWGQTNKMISWLICGTDTNAHFAGCGSSPRRRDDWAAVEVRRFIKRFGLVSLAEEMYPAKATRISSGGHISSMSAILP